MNKLLPFFCLLLFAVTANAQCDDLFFSEYVEGYANNKALEIYNPTDAAINLSSYSIVRFSNGSTTAGSDKVISLPNEMLEAGDVFVVVVDLTDTMDWDSQFDKPAWNGYNLIDTIFDAVTGEVVIDEETGEPLLGPQYQDGNALFGTEYNEKYDLQCKADAFLCPDYETNNAMYFNGNDAMALITGTTIATDGSNILDVIGVIGENPENWSMPQDAWITEDGGWITKDKTIVRNANVMTGRNTLSDVISSLGGSFVGEEWTIYGKNDFSYLGIHKSGCHPEQESVQYSCITGAVSGTSVINAIEFKVYPNPNSAGSLDIQADENIDRVEIVNLMGQTVLAENYNYSQSAVSFSLGSIAKGVYVVKVHFADNMISTQKLIVQ
ncbi:MAG: lamin tail domain-containing protein [Phaeodactylibacter sp.]|nr:lamin tail domain-containing protein [Phaeodactylibacter sp.]